jgi:hypothetical protein
MWNVDSHGVPVCDFLVGCPIVMLCCVLKLLSELKLNFECAVGFLLGSLFLSLRIFFKSCGQARQEGLSCCPLCLESFRVCLSRDIIPAWFFNIRVLFLMEAPGPLVNG